jgi:hypothetical protein
MFRSSVVLWVSTSYRETDIRYENKSRKCREAFVQSIRQLCSILYENGRCREILVKAHDMRCHENLSGSSRPVSSR